MVALEDQQADSAIGKPGFQATPRREPCPGQGRADSSRSPATISRDTRRSAEQGREPSECFFERMGNHAVAGGAPGPLISQVNVGDDRGSLCLMDGSPFRCELPAVKARETLVVSMSRSAASLQFIGVSLQFPRLRPEPRVQPAEGVSGRFKVEHFRLHPARSRPRRTAKAPARLRKRIGGCSASQRVAAGTSRMSSSTSRRVSRSNGWSGQADLIIG